ncbi:uncharacterized protein EAE98_008628 [Botrytis deweyae]|uniref:LysM domain-containing protein n=1 Tax=Botrytis deweyae TaxID=2478750 RepID=A0ABQ7IEH7_9HELO|nr:uncharacterized protein EAE98_008628 [Botrytis deweyae]KAF7921202.1 hypothetical protein EAE98_008628 [Botrytis deweyae]
MTSDCWVSHNLVLTKGCVGLTSLVRWTLLLLFVGINDAQVFHNSLVDVGFPGISTLCLNALNSSVACNDSLPTAIWTPGVYLDVDSLASLCIPTCKESLQVYQSSTKKACTFSDVFVSGEDNLAYPASTWPDRYLYYYEILCLRDVASAQFCSSVFDSWTTPTAEKAEQDCSDCALGIQQLELGSPYGYLSDAAVDFASTTSSCGKTGYPYTSPTAIALNSSSTSSVTATPTPCATPYTIKNGEDCNSIARTQKVSTFWLLYENNLQAYCANFPAPGKSVCIPKQCDVYTVGKNDTCRSIISTVPGDITLTQLSSWNPNINIACGNLGQLYGTEICISPRGGWKSSTSDTSPNSMMTAAPVPATIANGTNIYCAKYYVIQAGDSCASVSIQQSISLIDFYFLNPNINSNCTNIIAGESYCVEAVGSISTYTSSQKATITANPCLQASPPSTCLLPIDITLYPSAPYWSEGASVVGNKTIKWLDPVASDTIPTCYEYREYYSLNTTNTTFLKLERDINKCDWVAGIEEITLANFLSWNPSLAAQDPTNCTLSPGYRYCIQRYKPTPTIVPTSTSINNPFIAATATDAPPGTAKNCDAYGSMYGGDIEDITCDNTLKFYAIDLPKFYALNPWVNSDCSGFYSGLNSTSFRSFCVGTSSSAASAPPAPAQSGIVSTCSEFYTVQPGDTCPSIELRYGILFEQFLAWNPAVLQNCTLLIIGDSVCVSAPTPASNILTSTSASTATPTEVVFIG